MIIQLNFNRRNGYCEQTRKMKLILSTLLAVLLSRSCSSGNELDNPNGKPETQFSDLREDVLRIIFDHLGFGDLLNVVQINSTLTEVVSNAFRRKYRPENQLEIIAYKRENKTGASKTQAFTVDSNQLTIHDVPLTLNVLQYFGDHFKSIKFSYAVGAAVTDLEEIIRCFSVYCSKTLKKLELGIGHNLLDRIETPFEATEELSIATKNVNFNQKTKLGDLFPRLRRLILKSFGGTSYGFLNTTLPRLEHFFISVSDNEYSRDEYIFQFIQQNPSIRSIDPKVRNPHLVEVISEHLPNVESLIVHSALHHFVQFKSLKHLDFSDGDAETIDKLSAPSLESLTISYNPNLLDDWKAFFKNHTQIRRLFMIEIYDLEFLRNVDQFTADLPELTDATFDLYRNIDDSQIDSIVAFFQNHTKLNRCKFLVAQFTPDQQEILDELLGSEWNINFENNSFQRKPEVKNYSVAGNAYKNVMLKTC